MDDVTAPSSEIPHPLENSFHNYICVDGSDSSESESDQADSDKGDTSSDESDSESSDSKHEADESDSERDSSGNESSGEEMETDEGFSEELKTSKGKIDISLDYVTSVDLWSDIIAME